MTASRPADNVRVLSVRQAVPESVRQAAAKAAGGTRERRTQLMAAAGVLLAASVALRWRRRR